MSLSEIIGTDKRPLLLHNNNRNRGKVYSEPVQQKKRKEILSGSKKQDIE